MVELLVKEIMMQTNVNIVQVVSAPLFTFISSPFVWGVSTLCRNEINKCWVSGSIDEKPIRWVAFHSCWRYFCCFNAALYKLGAAPSFFSKVFPLKSSYENVMIGELIASTPYHVLQAERQLLSQRTTDALHQLGGSSRLIPLW